MTEELKLLPCPFCGETPGADSHTLTDGGFKYGAIHCGCGAIGPDVRTEYKDWPHWKDAAVSEWNTRAQLHSLHDAGEAVAWQVSHPKDGWRSYDQYPTWAEDDKQLTIRPLYTHPTDPDAVIVPRKSLERVAAHLEWDGAEPMTTIQYAYKCDALAAELRALLAKEKR